MSTWVSTSIHHFTFVLLHTTTLYTIDNGPQCSKKILPMFPKIISPPSPLWIRKYCEKKFRSGAQNYSFFFCNIATFFSFLLYKNDLLGGAGKKWEIILRDTRIIKKWKRHSQLYYWPLWLVYFFDLHSRLGKNQEEYATLMLQIDIRVRERQLRKKWRNIRQWRKKKRHGH